MSQLGAMKRSAAMLSPRLPCAAIGRSLADWCKKVRDNADLAAMTDVEWQDLRFGSDYATALRTPPMLERGGSCLGRIARHPIRSMLLALLALVLFAVA